MAGAKSKEKKGNCSIRSPSSAKRKYSDDEKLTVCIMYQYLKDTDKVAEYCDMPSSSVRYILKNNKKLREKAERLVLDISESGAAEFAERLQNTAMDAIETLLAAVVGDEAIAKSNSQQLAIAMATLMDKFSLVPAPEQKEESGGVIILSPVVKKG